MSRQISHTLLLLLVLAMAVAACGSSTSSPATGSAAPSSASSAPATPPSATSSPRASGGSVGGGDLRPLLPTSIGGHTLVITQFSGDEFLGGGVSTEMVDLLTSIGRTPSDMTLAFAADPSGGTDLNVTAFRVRDVPVETFLAAYLPVLAAANPGGSITPGIRAGRQVYTAIPTTASPTQVLVPRGDVLFVVISTVDALVDEAIAALP